MTGPIADSQPARDNESEHAELAGQGTDLVNFMVRGDEAGLSDSVKAAVMGLEDAEHKALAQDLQDVADLLKKEIGQDKVTARTRRHLYQRVRRCTCLSSITLRMKRPSSCRWCGKVSASSNSLKWWTASSSTATRTIPDGSSIGWRPSYLPHSVNCC